MVIYRSYKLEVVIITFMLVGLSGCSSIKNTSERRTQRLSDRTVNAMAACSGNYKETEKVVLAAQYSRNSGELSGGVNESNETGILTDGNVNGEHRVKLYQEYVKCIDKRLVDLETKGDLPTKNVVRETTQSKKKKHFVPRTTKLNGVGFTLNKCIRENMDVSCHFTLKSDGQNKLVQFTQKSRLYDDNGNEYRMQSARIANTEQSNMINYRVKKLLIANISTKAVINFKNFSTNANMISYLKFGTYVEKTSKFLEFRDISLASQ